jgi:hypothetical protein
MELARSNTIANCSISTWDRRPAGGLRTSAFNQVQHLHREGVEPTMEEEVHAEPI